MIVRAARCRGILTSQSRGKPGPRAVALVGSKKSKYPYSFWPNIRPERTSPPTRGTCSRLAPSDADTDPVRSLTLTPAALSSALGRPSRLLPTPHGRTRAARPAAPEQGAAGAAAPCATARIQQGAGRRPQLQSGGLAFTVLLLFVCSNPTTASNLWYFPTANSLIPNPNCLYL